MKAKLARSMGASPSFTASGVASDSLDSTLAPPLTVATARRGDEPLVQDFLRRTGWPVNATDYLAQLEQPGYETAQRLLVRRGESIVGHLRTSYRSTWFGDLSINLSQFHELGVDRRLGSSAVTALWDVAQSASRAERSWGALTAFPAGVPSIGKGFVDLPAGVWAQVRPAALLAHLGEQNANPAGSRSVLDAKPKTPVTVRMWRQVEQRPLRRLYETHRRGVWGVRERDDEYWRWLTARRAYHWIYLAVSGDPNTGFHDPDERVLGYAVMRGGDVIEWVVGCREAAIALLRRMGREAIEHNGESVRFSPPLASPELTREYEQWMGACGSPVAPPFAWRMKIYHPLRLLDRLRPTLAARAKNAGIKPGAELGFDVDGHRFRLVVGARSVRFDKGKLGRSYLATDCENLLRLMLGVESADSLANAGAVAVSTQLAGRTAAALFPANRWWLSSWDEMPATEP